MKTPLTPTIPTSKLWAEWAPRLNGRKGIMVPQDRLGSFSQLADAGLRSVYLFEEKDAVSIQNSNCSKGLSERTVWSDCLFIDVDGGDGQLARVLQLLPEVGYSLYSSGSKGYHLHIHHAPIKGPIPEAHAEWVESHGIPADYSIYRRSSLIRLPGCVHPKTKQKKRLLMVVDGPQPEFWQPALKAPVQILEGIGDASDVLLRAARLAENQPRQGDRHTALWSLSQGMKEAGFSMDTTLEIARKVNNQWPEPKDDEEVERAVSQAFHSKRRYKST